jgi:hypothetical protein
LAPVNELHDFVLVSAAPALAVADQCKSFCTSRALSDAEMTAFGLEATSVKLIRPDGHVGLACGRDVVADVVAAYFAQLGLN